jgi:hypothetical protein
MGLFLPRDGHPVRSFSVYDSALGEVREAGVRTNWQGREDPTSLPCGSYADFKRVETRVTENCGEKSEDK